MYVYIYDIFIYIIYIFETSIINYLEIFIWGTKRRNK